LKLIGLLPFKFLLWLGRRLGDIAYLANIKRKQIAALNISLALPELDAKSQRRLVHKTMQSLGMGFMESLYAWNAPLERIKSLGQVEGLANIPADKPAILLFAHFTSLEIGGIILALNTPISAMFKEQKSKFANRSMYQGRSRVLTKVIPNDDIRSLIKTLRQNGKVYYAIDQHASGGEAAVVVDFFGMPAATRSSTSKIAKLTGAEVLQVSILRKPDYTYSVTIHPALVEFGNDKLADTQRLMDAVERDAKARPEQYFWVHKRFKAYTEANRLYEL
jgi:KDO2-lipid IV(A) lauroyltransferase